MRFFLVTATLCTVLAVTVSAQSLSERELLLPSASTSAVGGIHAASLQGMSTLFSNPASFVAVPSTLSIAELNVGVKGPVFTIAGLLLSGASNILTSPALSSLIPTLYTGANIAGPLAFGYVGNGLGFGIFNDSDVLLATTGPGTVSFETTEKVVLAGGYAFRIPLPGIDGALDLGVSLKGFVSGTVTVTGSILAIDSILTSLSSNTLLTNPFDVTSGIGLDAGVRLSLWHDMLAVGLSAANLYTPGVVNHYASVQDFLNGTTTSSPASSVLAPMDFSIGVEFTPPLGKLSRYINEANFYFDYRNFLDFLMYPATAENIWLKFSIGAQVRILKIVSVRAGFARGLPAFGLGLNLTAFTLNAAVYGDELSTEPGLKSVYNVLIGFDFNL